MLLVLAIPFLLKASAYSTSHAFKEADTAADYISFSRSRFFEANLRQSFLRVLASAKGATPAQIVEDASRKLELWAAVSYDASAKRGFVPSLWVGCEGSKSKITYSALAGPAFFSSMLSFDSGQSMLKVKYKGNDSAIDALDCAKPGFGLGLDSQNNSFSFLFSEGLYALSNTTNPQDYGVESD